MKFRQWMNESRELSKRRMDILTEKLSIRELIEYRDNYERNKKVIYNMLMVFVAIVFAAMVIVCIFGEFNLADEATCNLYLGYLFGIGVSMMLFGCPSGSYERKLTKAIENKCLEELEEKECTLSEQ